MARVTDGSHERVYAKGTAVSREFVHRILREYGVPTLRRFWAKLFEAESAILLTPAYRVHSDAQHMTFEGFCARYEDMQRMLGFDIENIREATDG